MGDEPAAGTGITDAGLVRQARAGDEWAWSELIRRHQEGVFRFAYLHLGQAVEAEDVAQETFVRAFRQLDRFDLERPLRPWLLTICANLARNRQRSLGRYWRAIRRWAEGGRLESAHQAGPEPTVERIVQAVALRRMVNRLSARDQSLIYARFFLGLDVAETASMLQLPAGTVKSRQHRALKRLRAWVEAEMPEWADG